MSCAPPPFEGLRVLLVGPWAPRRVGLLAALVVRGGGTAAVWPPPVAPGAAAADHVRKRPRAAPTQGPARASTQVPTPASVLGGEGPTHVVYACAPTETPSYAGLPADVRELAPLREAWISEAVMRGQRGEPKAGTTVWECSRSEGEARMAGYELAVGGDVDGGEAENGERAGAAKDANKGLTVAGRAVRRRYPATCANEQVCGLLRELEGYELAVGGDLDGGEVNHQALAYARAAMSLRAVEEQWGGGDRRLEERVRGLDYVGGFGVDTVVELVRTGSCAALEAHRANADVADSAGRMRGVRGGRSKRELSRGVLGCGPATAAKWFEDFGIQSVAEAAEMMRRGEAAGGEGCGAAVGEEEGPGGGATARARLFYTGLNTKVRFGLEIYGDLAEGCTLEDAKEMEDALRDALTCPAAASLVDGRTEAWEVTLVGGALRGRMVKDADFVMSHPLLEPNGVRIGRVLHELVSHLEKRKRGKLLPRERGFQARVNWGFPTGHGVGRRNGEGGNLEGDMHAKVFGVFLTAAGKHCRIDLITCAWEQRACCLLSWTGNRMYNRVLRTHAKQDLGYALNAHYLVKQGASAPVPGLESERDIFEALGIPYLPPHLRNA